MSKIRLFLFMMIFSSLNTSHAASDGLNGEALFVEKCAMCHRERGMGTGLLARRMETALLEERTDLNSQAVIIMARMGIGNMPRISRGEVSDEQLQAIADYLSKK